MCMWSIYHRFAHAYNNSCPCSCFWVSNQWSSNCDMSICLKPVVMYGLLKSLCWFQWQCLWLVPFARIIHGAGFASEECKQFKAIVHKNAIESLVYILGAMVTLHIDFGDPEREASEHSKSFIETLFVATIKPNFNGGIVGVLYTRLYIIRHIRLMPVTVA